jgi:hypothetical protein
MVRRVLVWGGLALILGAPVRAEIIDRILAVVETSIITQSDVIAATRLGLQKPPVSGDPIAVVLDKLIERRLTLTEVDRYAPPEPSQSDIDLRIQQIRLSFPSTDGFAAVLKQTGLDETQLRRYVRDDLRIDAYVRQRFGSAVQPSEEQILDYYRAHPEAFSRNGVLRPFDDVHEEARVAVVAERRAAAIREWLTTLRRRANVNVLYVTP